MGIANRIIYFKSQGFGINWRHVYMFMFAKMHDGDRLYLYYPGNHAEIRNQEDINRFRKDFLEGNEDVWYTD